MKYAGCKHIAGVHMATYTKRVQTVLTDEQFETLCQLSKELDKPVSLLLREAIETVYFERAQQQRRQAALVKLLALNAPVADWDQMEEEIIRGANE